MLLAGPLGDNPRAVAERLRSELERGSAPPGSLERIEVAGPGFVNLFLADAWYRRALATLLAAGEELGPAAGRAEPERILVEFVSANPTGPLHVGGGRHAAYGDAIVRLLEAVGHEVEREYYVNDGGAQIDRFAASIAARMTGAELPEDGYEGEYVSELARAARAPRGSTPATARRSAGAGSSWCWRGCGGPSSASASASTPGPRERELYDRGEVEQALAELDEARPHLPSRRRHLAAHDRLRRRQGPGPDPRRRRADLPRRRHRLPLGQAAARLRPADRRARRRPPRLRGADAGGDRGARRRPRQPSRR